jgi:hypothetical protein
MTRMSTGADVHVSVGPFRYVLFGNGGWRGNSASEPMPC